MGTRQHVPERILSNLQDILEQQLKEIQDSLDPTLTLKIASISHNQFRDTLKEAISISITHLDLYGLRHHIALYKHCSTRLLIELVSNYIKSTQISNPIIENLLHQILKELETTS